MGFKLITKEKFYLGQMDRNIFLSQITPKSPHFPLILNLGISMEGVS